MPDQFPAIEPYDCGLLDVGDRHRIYWECCGNPMGKPALFLHGGPGSGCSVGQRRYFDPELYRAVLFDQRGSGRSTPLASDPAADLKTNATARLIADIEVLRDYLGVERWTILGLSWGRWIGLRPGAFGLRACDDPRIRADNLASRGAMDHRGLGRIFPG